MSSRRALRNGTESKYLFGVLKKKKKKKKTEYSYYPERIDPNIIIRMLFDHRENCGMGGRNCSSINNATSPLPHHQI